MKEFLIMIEGLRKDIIKLLREVNNECKRIS